MTSAGFGTIWLLWSAVTTAAPAQVVSTEFFVHPMSEGWDLVLLYCEPTLTIKDDWYIQQLDLDACPPGPGGGRDVYRRSLASLDGVDRFFFELRVETDGHQSEIPYGAPVVVAIRNDAGVGYNLTVASDLVKLLRDVDLPILFIQIDSGKPHAYRIEQASGTYAFYIDGYLIDEDVAEGPFPALNPRITWQGNAWYLPCQNRWDYLRYGVIPVDGSGDYDSDETVTTDDFYFVHDCLTKEGPGIFGGPANDAGPGCRFADFDADSDVDLLDFAEFANQFRGVGP